MVVVMEVTTKKEQLQDILETIFYPFMYCVIYMYLFDKL